jgi:hypothetical protein
MRRVKLMDEEERTEVVVLGTHGSSKNKAINSLS